MITKHFNLEKKIETSIKFFLLYGQNDGLINETIKKVLIPKLSKNVYNYDENEIINNTNIFIENITNKSFFENDKLIIINRASDKIIDVIEKLINKNLLDVNFIIKCGSLDKKSKMRLYFEKNKECLCVPFYEDNNKTLGILARNFFIKKNIQISSSDINIIIDKCNGDRNNLTNELNKIELFSKNRKKITSNNLIKLINLTENHNISELVNSCLAKNQKMTRKILNENNFSNEDCILIARGLLNKAKKILNLSIKYKKNNNLDLVIFSAKPPVFWKDREITKKQILLWSPLKIKKFIYELIKLELEIKRNIHLSIIFVINFILNKSKININN